MKVLCSFPGRNGDILWAGPVLRAISQHYGVKVDLQIAGEFTGIVPLLQRQPYLGHVWADPQWGMVPPEEWKAPAISGYDQVIHCGYRGWPERPLPFWTEHGVTANYPELAGLVVDYERPWIHVESQVSSSGRYGNRLSIGFSDEWIELKAGVVCALLSRVKNGSPYKATILYPDGSRWEEWEKVLRPHVYGSMLLSDWVWAAQSIQAAKVFFGCCSAPHVLACAMGKPVVLLEPSQARHNPIFYPFGMDGPRITVVKGNDGLPTVDARHCAETIERVLHAQ